MNVNPNLEAKLNALATMPFHQTRIEDFGDDVENEVAHIDDLCKHLLGVPVLETEGIDGQKLGETQLTRLQKLWELIPEHALIRPQGATWAYIKISWKEYNYLVSNWDGIVWAVRVKNEIDVKDVPMLSEFYFNRRKFRRVDVPTEPGVVAADEVDSPAMDPMCTFLYGDVVYRRLPKEI